MDKQLRGMLIVVLLLWAGLVSGCASGSRTKVALVADDSPVRLGPDVEGAVYNMIEGEWVLSPNRVALPEGWYLVPPRFVEPEDFAP